MAIINKLTSDAKLKLGIKEGTDGSFTAHFIKLTDKELKHDRNPAYKYLI